MKFRDLLLLPYNHKNDRICRVSLSEKLRNADTPIEVLEQFYIDHGRKYDFQKQYSQIHISKLNWIKTNISAYEVNQCSTNDAFQSWIESVKKRTSHFNTDGWGCIDHRKEVVDCWMKNKTWLKKPIFLAGSLIDNQSKHHLAEGHTRIAILQGLLERGVINETSVHTIWLGSY